MIFSALDSLAGGGADVIITIAIVAFAKPDVGQNPIGGGDGHRVGIDIAANDIAHLTQGFAVHMTEERQRFVGDIQR